MHLLDVPLDGADLERGQSGPAHDADEAVSVAVVVHQVLGPPARLVVPALVLPGVMGVSRGHSFAHSPSRVLLLFHTLSDSWDVRGAVLIRPIWIQDIGFALNNFCSTRRARVRKKL